MQAIPYLKKSKATNLNVAEWTKPTIKEDEVLIQVKAFGLNYADIMARNGLYPDAPKFPFIPGYEVAGLVEETGSQVTEYKKGDRVIGFTDFGGYAQYSKASVMGTIKMPDDMSFTDAAAIPVNYATAYHALFHTGLLIKGSRVLIHAAAGGVGLAAMQLANLYDCEIYATAGSARKLALCKEMGAHYVINYQEEDFVKEIKMITNNQGVDIVLDSIGGSTIKKDFEILRTNGRVAAFGVASLSNRGLGTLFQTIPNVFDMLTISGIDLLSRSLGFYGINMKTIGDKNPALLRASMDAVMKLFAEKKLQSHVHKVFPWEEIAEAHELLESRKSTGKIVLSID
jgi:synaptic vesicle membrane protein VAT-1